LYERACIIRYFPPTAKVEALCAAPLGWRPDERRLGGQVRAAAAELRRTLHRDPQIKACVRAWAAGEMSTEARDALLDRCYRATKQPSPRASMRASSAVLSPTLRRIKSTRKQPYTARTARSWLCMALMERGVAPG
jgi:hypothetical protein